MLFFALQGEHADGHDFIDEVFQKGACGAVIQNQRYRSLKQNQNRLIPVEDPLAALQHVATYCRQQLAIPVIAVTGTNGKTTTKEMIAAVLGTRFKVVKTPGNYNNHIGLALGLCGWDQKGEIGVAEMGTNHFGEIRRLCEIAQPTHGVITNIGKGHLEFFGTIEGVGRAKAELLEYLKNEGKVFINGDDSHLYALRELAHKTVTYGFSDRCDIRAIKLETDGAESIQMKIEEHVVHIPVPGEFNLYNALAAVSVGIHFGLSWKEIQDGLDHFQTVNKRMEVIRLSEIIILDDTYNANPSSVHEALQVLRTFQKEGRKIAVLGDMLELGRTSKGEHRTVGQWIADGAVDLFFAYGKEMQEAVASAKSKGFKEASHCNSKEDLIWALRAILRAKDVILIKGSRAMRMEEVVEGLKTHFMAGQ
ncbi:UDP-N-acetylmuramoyl-tripeptide--D-alanyl-D-alanine ligase [bacterium]|nr:UDP-N-acetylmuramoyl-tripeptide--D-alanyl-D-alanine ligase [bacterium]